MVVNGRFDIGLNLHLQCLRLFFFFFLMYCNMSLTRLNLFGIAIAFVILEIQTAQVVAPEGSGVTDCKFPLDDVNLAMVYCETPSLFGCLVEFLELSCKRRNQRSQKMLLILKLCI